MDRLIDIIAFTENLDPVERLASARCFPNAILKICAWLPWNLIRQLITEDPRLINLAAGI